MNFSPLVIQQLHQLLRTVECELCSIKFSNSGNASDHYMSKRHMQNVEAYLAASNKTSSGISTQKGYQENLVKNQNQSEAVSEAFFCHICNKNFPFKSKLIEHTREFPHFDLAKMKSDLIKKEIYSEYWSIHPKTSYVQCLTCNVQLQCSNNVVAHCKSVRHKTALEAWTNNTTKLKNLSEGYMLPYYCKICDQALDGTSNSKLHYTSSFHLDQLARSNNVKSDNKALPLKQVILSKQRATPSPVELSNSDKINKNQIKQKNSTKIFQPILPQQNVNPLIESANVPTFTRNIIELESEQIDGKPSLKEQIFNELEKIVQKLYYSKSVPYEVSLKYLKEFNRQIDDALKSTDNVSTLNKPLILQAQIPIKQNDNKPSNSKKAKISPKRVLENNEAQLVNISNNQNPTKINEDSDLNYKPTLEDKTERWETISDLLKAINASKLESEQDLEKNVLKEIEILLKKCDNDNIPLDETLKCLKQFNEELMHISNANETDLITFGDENMDSKSIQMLEPQKVNVVYSSEKLLALRTKFTFTDINSNLKDTLITSKIWKNADDNEDLEPNIYHYYAGNNFTNFMDFLEIYLQGSIQNSV